MPKQATPSADTGAAAPSTEAPATPSLPPAALAEATAQPVGKAKASAKAKTATPGKAKAGGKSKATAPRDKKADTKAAAEPASVKATNKAIDKASGNAAHKAPAKAPVKAAPKPKASRADKAPAAPKAKLSKKSAWPQGDAPAVKGKHDKDVAARAADAVKLKLVRDSFTMPELEYAQLSALKRRALGLAHHAKKSELLRAGVAALAALDDSALLAALQAVPPLKTGRPRAAGTPAA